MWSDARSPAPGPAKGGTSACPRPRSVTTVSWVFIAVGCFSLLRHALPLVVPDGSAERPVDLALAMASGLLAAAGGAFMLYGNNWARWLLVAWMGFHVALSVMHSAVELLVHGVLFAAVAYVLLRPPASAYFRGTTAASPTADPD